MPNTEPFVSPEGKRQYVLDMFSGMAGHYDRMNRVLSLGRDLSWRRTLAERANLSPDSRVLDVAAGTGDVTLILAERAPSGKVVGVDFARPMLALAAEKARRAKAENATLVHGDALRLPFADDTFDAATTAFSLRNITDVAGLFTEMRRVLRPCGRLACMEMCKPTLPVFRNLFGLYFNRVVPILGRTLARNREAYTYLPDSLNRFMTSGQVMRHLHEAGFRWVGCQKLMLGTVAIYVGLK